MEENKYEAMLAQYDTGITAEEASDAVRLILASPTPPHDEKADYAFLLSCVELTSLKTTDSEESLLALTEKVNRMSAALPGLPHVATICAYPRFASIISQSLEVDGVEVACVSGGFPSSQTFAEVKTIETSLAVNDGATEIDIVMSVGPFLNEDYESVCDEIGEIKAICGERKLKVILEVGLLGSLHNVMKASLLAMYAGADYVKTSTGKDGSVMSLEATYAMCQAIKQYYDATNVRIGIKPAGGINSIEDAMALKRIVQAVLGAEWLTPQLFRLGTSRLCNQLIDAIEGREVGYF